MKSNKGFTLVELIVVIAILAILAGIAIPAYSGYIKKANDAADNTALSAVKTATMATYATKGAVTEIVVTDNGASGDTIVVKVNGTSVETDDNSTATNADFKTFMNLGSSDNFGITLKTGKTATWTAAKGEWTITE